MIVLIQERGHDEHSENNHSHSRFDKKRRQYQDIIKKSKKIFCSKHGGPNDSHDEKDCYSKKKEGTTFESPLNRVYIDNNTSFIKPIRLGNVNVPRKATENKTCKFCGKLRDYNHRCQEFYDAKKKKHENNDKNVLMVNIDKEDVDMKDTETERLAEAMGGMVTPFYDCKYFNENTSNLDDPFRLITPIIIEGIRLIGRIDTGSDVTCINKYILNKHKVFEHTKIHKVDGYFNYLDTRKPRIGYTDPLTITYVNNIKFQHPFEVVEFKDIYKTQFDVLLGKDILSRLGVGLTGVAYRYADDPVIEDMQFENLNFDSDNKYDPENSDYGTPEERKVLMNMIQGSIDKNNAIKLGSFCNVPESIVKIPIKKNATNCYTRQYPLAKSYYPVIKEQLNEWLDHGLVVETKPSSRYNSALWVVPKKDEDGNVTKYRIVCDLRRINANISEEYREDYCIPNIQDIFERVSKEGMVYTKLDLKNAYHSFKVYEPDQEVLSFTFDGRTYKWQACCFGLRTISQLFCKVMKIILSDIEGVEAYVDDVLLYSKPDVHATLIKTVIDKLTDSNLKINFGKSQFFKTCIYTLGFVVGPGITKLDIRRLSTIDQWKIPKTTSQVRSLMSVISFMRNYIPAISKLAAPLDALRNENNIKGKWTEDHTKRLNAIKEILQANFILHNVDLNQRLYLHTDASCYGLSAVLFCKDKYGRDKYIALASKSLNEHQRRWSTNRREIAAVIFGLQRFRSILLGHPNFEVRVDHSSLVYLYTSTYLSNNLQSYIELLNEYGYINITHIKGIDNVLPDRISRMYPPIEEDIEQRAQEDTLIRKLEKAILIKRAKLENNRKEAFIKRKTIKHSKDADLAVLAMKLSKEEYKKATLDYIAPPESERQQLIQNAHKMGHFGVEAVTKNLLSEGFYWNTMYKDCDAVIKSCKPCALHTITKRGYNPKRSIVCFEPFGHIAMDLCGPLPITENGTVYILIIVDVCTKYIIARPLRNKQSDTVMKALVQVFGDYGLPIIGHITQSDNGGEFTNKLFKDVFKLMGFEHRYSLPYHSEGNGVAEQAVKIVTTTLRKLCGNDVNSWDERLPTAQLCCNLKVRSRTGSTPFSLIYARKLNITDPASITSKNNSQPTPDKYVTEEELIQRAEVMSSLVFPAIRERTLKIVEEFDKKYNKKHYLIDIPIGTSVMVKLESRATKMSPVYAGPYTVCGKTKHNNYILRDETNELLSRNYTPSELKIVNIDETAIEDELYEVEDIRDHRGGIHNREYLVKWKGYSDRESSWLTEDAFSSPEPIRKYWVKVRQLEELDRERKRALNDASDKTQNKKRKTSSNKNLHKQGQTSTKVPTRSSPRKLRNTGAGLTNIRN